MTAKKAGAAPRAGIGLRAHSGWAALVAVAGTPRSPDVLVRRRIELSDPAVEGSKQPYHAAEGKPLPKAARIIDRCAGDAGRLARQAFREVIAELQAAGHRAAGCGLLLASGRPLPALDSILASHALIHTADGELFRDALAAAGEENGWTITRVKEKEVYAAASAGLRVPAEELQSRVNALGRSLGPPWTQDQKLAAVAGWLALALSEES
jgi:hypothetical protein